MSGSGSSGFGGGFERSTINCEGLVLNTQIASPQQTVIHQLSVNDILQVDLQAVNTTTAIVLIYSGKVVGAVAAPDMQRLRECIEGGTRYEAKVTATSGAHVSIRIAAA